MSEILNRLLREGEARGIAKGEARGIAKGRAEGKLEGILESARSLIKLSVPVMTIMQATGLSLEKLQEISQQVGVALVR